MHLQVRLDLSWRHPRLELLERGAGAAQARGEAVDRPVTLSPWSISRSPIVRARAGVALQEGVGERPDGALGGIGDHRLEVSGSHLPRLSRPDAPGAPARCERRTGLAPIRSTRSTRRRRLEPETESLCLGRSARGISRALGASNSWTSPPAAADRTAQLRRRPWRGQSGPRSDPEGAAPARRRRRRAGARASARPRRRAGSVGTRSATSPGSTARRASWSGAPRPSPGSKTSQRGGAALALGAGAQPRPGRVDLRLVGAGDQVERADLLGHG